MNQQQNIHPNPKRYAPPGSTPGRMPDAAMSPLDLRYGVQGEQSKADAYENTVNRGVNMLYNEGQRLSGESDARHAEKLQFQQDEFQQANQPTVTNEDIQRMYGAAADQAALEASEMLKTVRQHLGGAGVRGGAAAGLAASIEAQRLSSLTGAKRDLQIYKMNADAQDRINRYQRSLTVADTMGEEPSPFLADILSTITALRVGQQGMDAQLKMASEANKSQQQMGALNMILGAVTGGAGMML